MPKHASRPEDLPSGTAVVLAAPNSAHAVARSLGRLGIAVDAVYSSRDRVARSRYWRRVFVLNISEDAGSTTALRLSEMARHVGDAAPLIAMTDDQARFVAAHAEILGRHYVLSVAKKDLIAKLSDKELLSHLCRSVGVPTPATYVPESAGEAEQLAASARLPLIVKARKTQSSGDQIRVVARTPAVLRRVYSSIDPAMYMLQEYVQRTNGSRWMFNGYFDAKHECRFGLTAVKVREHPLDGGVASLAESRWNPRLAAEATAFLQRIGYVGPVDIDYCYDKRRDEYMVLDVNPRLGAAFRAFVDSRGWDVARVMVADLTGVTARLGTPVEGRRWLAEHADLAAAFEQHRRGVLRIGRYIGSFMGVRELAWFAVDDPRPIIDMSRRAVGKLRLGDGHRRGKQIGDDSARESGSDRPG